MVLTRVRKKLTWRTVAGGGRVGRADASAALDQVGVSAAAIDDRRAVLILPAIRLSMNAVRFGSVTEDRPRSSWVSTAVTQVGSDGEVRAVRWREAGGRRAA
ncbi:hypothetical protein VSH64_28570 [Amycolatopsis rhabdoformis]|uniref:Uncharacterized protein n=1 Tax=Amycolatopsis rhabdoformis TaxID=1448059 RepID=A0ABZ1HZP2_9PSEU|nr:hypothetical protein [Amycolatopsis rhabdoformis]WSE26828.1 hypothetical protein VSH64_28570 [Amycolatopsis rhabdoformis]